MRSVSKAGTPIIAHHLVWPSIMRMTLLLTILANPSFIGFFNRMSPRRGAWIATASLLCAWCILLTSCPCQWKAADTCSRTFYRQPHMKFDHTKCMQICRQNVAIHRARYSSYIFQAWIYSSWDITSKEQSKAQIIFCLNIYSSHRDMRQSFRALFNKVSSIAKKSRLIIGGDSKDPITQGDIHGTQKRGLCMAYRSGVPHPLWHVQKQGLHTRSHFY